GVNTQASGTRSGWRRPALNRLWAAWATRTTTRWPRRSTDSTKLRLFIVGAGQAAPRLKWPRLHGSTGGTTGVSWNRSETSLQPRPRHSTTRNFMIYPWRRNSHHGASEIPGAVH